jgi:hypothetical protein
LSLSSDLTSESPKELLLWTDSLDTEDHETRLLGPLGDCSDGIVMKNDFSFTPATDVIRRHSVKFSLDSF